MPSTVVLLLSAVLLNAPTSSERVVLANDTASPGFEQTLVRHMLMQTLLTESSQDVVADIPTSPSDHRASRLRRRALRHVQRAKQALDGLVLDTALQHAAQARQQLLRVARLTGDTTDLPTSLGLLACSLLLQGAPGPADLVLQQLLLYQPSWRPDPAYFNPSMQAQVEKSRKRLRLAPTRPLQLQAPSAAAALFVDGVFVGFGHARVPVAAHLSHIVWALMPDGQHVTSLLDAPSPSQRSRLPSNEALRVFIALPVVPEASSPNAAQFAQLIDASRSTSGVHEAPAAPALRASGVRRAYVLGYADGELKLTHLQWQPSQLRRVQVPAIVTDLNDARQIAEQLLADAPELVPVPVPVR